jgi:aldehyde:ferredoxin oxidoreductase
VGYFEDVCWEEILEKIPLLHVKGTGLMQAVGHRGDPLPLRGSLLEVDWHHANDWFQQVAQEQFGDSEAAIPTSYKGKARSAVISEHMERVADNMGICKWLYGLCIYNDMNMACRIFSLATGKEWDIDHILKTSERVRMALNCPPPT